MSHLKLEVGSVGLCMVLGFGANNTSKTDVAPWCYKWIGLDGIRVGWSKEHLSVLIIWSPLAEEGSVQPWMAICYLRNEALKIWGIRLVKKKVSLNFYYVFNRIWIRLRNMYISVCLPPIGYFLHFCSTLQIFLVGFALRTIQPQCDF